MVLISFVHLQKTYTFLKDLEGITQKLSMQWLFQFKAIKGHGRLLRYATTSKFSKMIHFS